jgi:beta-barrel assembly-enhancing protease
MPRILILPLIRPVLIALICLGLVAPAFPVALQDPAKSQPTVQDPPNPQAIPDSLRPEEFKFDKVDLELLEQVELLDRRLEREGLVLQEEATNAYLARVGKVLVPRDLKLENVQWKFRAVRDPVPNAFALPNGSIYVTTGLLALMDNESQLAAVVAHEMTHVMRRHTYLQNRSNRKKILAINIINAVGVWNPAGGVAGAAIAIITTISPFIVVATIFGYSRELEREADLKGVELMRHAEYPPEEMVKMLKLLANDIEGEQIRLFYNDHPALNDRIKYVSSFLGSRAETITPAMELNREKSAYFRRTEAVMRHDIQLAISAGRFRSALYLAKRLMEFNPDSSENVFWLAEAYRTIGPRLPELTGRELTNSAKKDAAKKRLKTTVEEEESALLLTEAGQQNWKTHQQKAEQLYLSALEMKDPMPVAHRGLGMLYEKLARPSDAIAQYEKYLELAPAAIDRERFQRRIEALRKR